MADKDASLAIENAKKLLDEETETLQEVHKLKPLKSMLRNMSISLKEFDGEEENHPEAAKWLRSIRDTVNDAQNKIDSVVVHYKLLKQKSMFKKFLSGRRAVKQQIQAMLEVEELIKKGISLIETMRHSCTNLVVNLGVDNFVRESLTNIAENTVTEILNSDFQMRQHIKRESQREARLIIGEESLGETTLAKMVYNDAKINHLSCREWVIVPPEFPHGSSLWRIFKDTRPSSSQTKASMSMLEFEAELYQNTKGKKYLLVMDKQSDCEIRDALFPDEPDGSQIRTIQLPSRQPMALQVSQIRSYKTDSQETWKGSSRKVVAQAAILNQAGKIEETLSGFLKNSDHEGILAANDNLPREVQRCLWYFGALSADFDIPAKKLIQMWAAEGLLNRNSSKRPEEIGEDYLEELRSRSFIQKSGNERGDAHLKTYRINSAVWIHNYVSHICRSEDGVQKFSEDTTDNTPIKKDIRWLGIHNNSFMKILEEFENSLHVTSLHCFGNIRESIPINSATFSVALHHKFPNVKVLNLDSLVLESVPKELGKLHHLRYLRLRAPSATHLPPPVISLPFLETLDMRESSLYSMPHEIWKMKRLRHIYLASFTMPDPHGIKYYKNLWSLQSLSGVHPDKVLKRLMVKAKFPNVTKLRICTLESKAASKFLKSIDHLYHLQSLRIENPTKLPDPNAFPLSLTKLTFLGTRLQPNCVKTLEKLPNLITLKLLGDSISGKEIECGAGGFPQLEVLFLINLVLEKLTRGKGAMRCLKHLFTNKPVNLEILPNDLRQMATLST